MSARRRWLYAGLLALGIASAASVWLPIVDCGACAGPSDPRCVDCGGAERLSLFDHARRESRKGPFCWRGWHWNNKAGYT